MPAPQHRLQCAAWSTLSSPPPHTPPGIPEERQRDEQTWSLEASAFLTSAQKQTMNGLWDLSLREGHVCTISSVLLHCSSTRMFPCSNSDPGNVFLRMGKGIPSALKGGNGSSLGDGDSQGP